MRYLFCLWILMFSTCVSPSRISLVVFVNRHTGIEHLTYEDLYQIYTLKQRSWDNGNTVYLVHLSRDQIDYGQFVESYLLTGINVYERRLHAQTDSGKGTPVYATSTQAMLDYVKQNPGGIGYARLKYEPKTCFNVDLCVIVVD